MRTWLLSPSCAVSVEAVESINAELRRGGPLVGRTSRRVSQSGLRKNRIWGSTAALSDSAWNVALPACPEPVEGRPSALRLLITWEPVEEPHQAPDTHFPDEPIFELMLNAFTTNAISP